MNSFNICLVLLVIVSTSLANDKNFRCGDQWFSFNEEKCYQIVNRSLTRDEAVSACGGGVIRTSYMSSIVTIKSKAEQKFLENYLFNEWGFDENAWIGAKRYGNESHDFQWEDGSHIHYQNWDKDRPSEDQNKECVQMEASNGKWVDLSCDRKGITICEKLQIWTFPELINSFFDWRRHLEHRNEELIEELMKRDSKIKGLEKSLNDMNRRLSSLRTEFERKTNDLDSILNNTIEMIVEESDKTKKRISNLEKKTDNIVDGMLALHDECSNGCSGSGGASDEQLENIKKKIIKEIEKKLEPIEDKLDDTVTDARLAIISYRRTLQIMKKDKWISLGHV